MTKHLLKKDAGVSSTKPVGTWILWFLTPQGKATWIQVEIGGARGLVEVRWEDKVDLDWCDATGIRDSGSGMAAVDLLDVANVLHTCSWL